MLAARALLEHSLDAATPNAIRTLFQLKRVEIVTALMSEVVLVPEGTFDFEWLSLLSRVVELQSGAAAAGTFFSATVGTVPTQNGAIEETANRMRRCHSRVVGLVDGDATGRGYAKNLVADGIQYVLRWPDEWMIEDVIGWIIEPADAAVLAALAADIVEPPLTVADLVERLKSDDSKNLEHLKGDRIAYEAIARAISDQPVCLARAAELLDGLARAAKGEATPRFAKTATDSALIFQP